jgi:hypothetical protein
MEMYSMVFWTWARRHAKCDAVLWHAYERMLGSAVASVWFARAYMGESATARMY